MWALFRNDAGSCRLWALPQGPMLSSPLGRQHPGRPVPVSQASRCYTRWREGMADFPWDPQEGVGPGGHRSSVAPSQNSPRLLGAADASHSLHPEPA